MKKYIFVTGGVCSSLGKGVSASSIGSLLECRGLRIRMVKIDPYINVDAGTMSPYQHGEVYVTDDGAETDLDLGNYARYTNSPLDRRNSITTGQVYQEVIQKERQGKYLGRTVQVIPHITDEIKSRILAIGEQDGVDVTIVEIGGTVGDIESIPFLEAARQFIHDKGKKNVLFVHLTLIPQTANGELKTKPTQHAVKEILEIGIQSDILLCRAPAPLADDLRKKISLFTNVEEESVISAHDVSVTVYEIPLDFHDQDLDRIILEKLGMDIPPIDLSPWNKVVHVLKTSERSARIGIVGKYIHLHDSYKSIYEALYHGGIPNGAKVELVKIDSETLGRKELGKEIDRVDGVLVPGGFGQRGIQGMVDAATYCRENGVPYLGICLGMQVMVVEYARSVLGLEGADSTEFAPETAHPVVSLLEEQIDIALLGGTMRLGRSETVLQGDCILRKLYGRGVIHERHRHRYEVSNQYRQALADGGLIICGLTPDGNLVEAVQWPNHPWGVGVQFHPEFTSKPIEPSPLFAGFIGASLEHAGKDTV